MAHPKFKWALMAKLITVYLYQNITDYKVMSAGSMGVCLLQNPQNPEKCLACNNNSVCDCWCENIRPKQVNCAGSNEWYLLFLSSLGINVPITSHILCFQSVWGYSKNAPHTSWNIYMLVHTCIHTLIYKHTYTHSKYSTC